MHPPLRSPLHVVLLALLLGVSADRLFIGRWVGLSAPVFIIAGLLALAWLSISERRRPTTANLWIIGALLLFATFLAVRDAPVLVALNSLAVIGLLLLLAAHYRSRALAQFELLPLLATWLQAGVQLLVVPPQLVIQSVRAVPIRRVQFGPALPIARGVLLAVPALFCFGGLLMAADSVFASYMMQTLSFHIPLNVAELFNHSLISLVAAALCAGGLVAALSIHAPGRIPAEGDTQRLMDLHEPWRPLGWIEACTVLVLVDVLFGTFLVVQAAYFFGGLDTLDRTGMTYANYARRGFFELVVVACLALGVLWLLATLTQRQTNSARRLFNAASSAMVVFVLGMLVSAFQRMWLYEEAYGFTQLRIYTHSFMVWLAVILLLFLGTLLRDRLRLFAFGSFIAALLYLATLNLANPDALIARANIARYTANGKLDASYLASLSADATPDLVAAFGQVDSDTQAVFRSAFDEQQQILSEAQQTQGWPAWSLARARALAAINRVSTQ